MEFLAWEFYIGRELGCFGCSVAGRVAPSPRLVVGRSASVCLTVKHPQWPGRGPSLCFKLKSFSVSDW